jgi:diacylglycerol kinase (ATP)
MSGRIVAIVNPRSGGGRTGKGWAGIQVKLAEAIGPVTAMFTDAPMAATRLTAEALADGAELVIAVGGDGTVNEVVNGFFDAESRPRNPAARLGLIMSGTGGDFRKTLGIEDNAAAFIDRLKQGTERTVDIGRVTFTGHDGETRSRQFINIASFGLSGLVVQKVNSARVSKLFGGSFSFLWNTFAAMVDYKLPRVRIRIDDGPEEIVRVHTVAIANARFFGGGMMIAPDADPSDGLFDIVTLADVTPFEMAKQAKNIYAGNHTSHPKVTITRGRRLEAAPVEGEPAVFIDVDGEGPGRLPATYEILPGALTLRC